MTKFDMSNCNNIEKKDMIYLYHWKTE